MLFTAGKNAAATLLHLRPRLWLASIVVAFLALWAGFSYRLPIFEGFDEAAHYRVADYYARQWSLPDLERAPSHEAHQPPLYYALAALLIAPIDRSDFDRVFQINPEATVNVRQNHVAGDTSFAPHGTTLAVRVLRLFSALLGATTVVLTYLLARQLQLSPAIGLLAAALLAFNPKFLLLSASVSNDVATVCLAAACLVFSARVLLRRPSILAAFVLGALVGLATLSKLSGVALALPAAVALTWSVLAHDRGRAAMLRLLTVGIALAAGGLLLTAWLFALQWIRYGNPLAWEQVNALNLFTQRDAPLTLAQIMAILPGILPTLWRVASGSAPQGIGDAVAILTLAIAGVGWGIGAVRKTLPAGLLLLPLAIVASLIALLPWLRTHGGTEDSRLLPTMFSCMSILIAAGMMSAVRWPVSCWIAACVAALSLAWAVAVPSALIAPLYPPLQPLRADQYVLQMPASEVDALPQRPEARFENGIELAKATILNDRLSPGDLAHLSLVWRVTRPITASLELVIEAFDAQGRSIGRLDSLPLAGRKWTRSWQIGDVYRDDYALALMPAITDSPVIANLFVGWHDTTPPYRIVTVQGSSAASALFGRVKVRAAELQGPKPQQAVTARFGGVIGLEGYDLAGEELTLHWRALDHVPADYQVFVHVLDSQGKIIAQADGPLPFPAALWDPQELILDHRVIQDVAHAQAVEVGVYDLEHDVRLKAQRADGSLWPSNSVELWKRSTP